VCQRDAECSRREAEVLANVSSVNEGTNEARRVKIRNGCAEQERGLEKAEESLRSGHCSERRNKN